MVSKYVDRAIFDMQNGKISHISIFPEFNQHLKIKAQWLT